MFVGKGINLQYILVRELSQMVILYSWSIFFNICMLQKIPNVLVGWLFWVKLPFETVFQSISGRLPERGRKKREKIDERKNVQTTRTYCKRSRP